MTPAASTSSAASAAGYSPGLEGVIAGESAICQVDPDAGLLYRGYRIESIATTVSFEQVAYLLLMGEFPDGGQLASFRAQLAAAAPLPGQVFSMFQALPRTTHPMDATRTGISMLAGFDPELSDHSHQANLSKSIRIIAKMPTLTAAYWRIRGGAEPIPPRADLSHAANLLYMLGGQMPQDWQTQALNTMLNLYAEHEFNASTFAARVTASTLADIYAAITAAIGALKGALHGGANEDAVNVLHEIGSPQNVAAWVQDKLAARQKIAGFGHRVYRKGDSRVASIRGLAIELAQRGSEQDRNLVRICQALEQAMASAKGLFANADLYAAPVFHMLGLPPALNTPIFACARAAGWCAHVIEQHDHNRIIRPRSLYTGPPARDYTPC
ncbi:citrate/2-methylcitrate synthase [Fontivita pretiosa]|uniref:citrate/2-methylcitrate synthase n=1 Tax=Fontivita pretiosa TaxID=2989684 RepID=UPI003D1836D3